MFKKVLIANRAEIALRLVRACRQLQRKTGARRGGGGREPRGKAGAGCSEGGRESVRVRVGDEAVGIGRPRDVSGCGGVARILAAAEVTNADASHPGYGFLAENAQFAEA